MPSTVGDNYVHAGNTSARDAFNRRTLDEDAALVLPYLRAGMSLVDFGCGAGSLMNGFARLLAPGEVTGIDSLEHAVDRARELAQQAGVTNAG